MVAIGVDTHKASLAACAIDEAGRVAAERSFANSPAGHRAFGRWLEALPLPRRVGIEGSGSFGAALAQGLLAAGEEVREVPAILTHRERRRTGRPGKSDSVDALAIARVVLREEALPAVRGPHGYRDLKLLVDSREQLIAEQTRLRNRLHSDLQVLAPGYGARLGRLGDLRHASGISAARRLLSPYSGIAVELTAMRLARLEALAAEIAANKLRIEGVLAGEHAALTAICGVGPLHRGAPPRGDR